MQRILNGVSSLTLTEALNNFLSLQENVNRNHFMRYMTGAKWVWNDLLKDTIWNIRRRVETVRADGTIELPRDVERLTSISVVDECGNLQPLFYNENINNLKVLSHQSKCSCNSCGGSDDTLCCVFDNITYTDEVKDMQVLDDDGNKSYRIRTYIIKDDCGGVTKEMKLYGPQTVNNIDGTNDELRVEYTEKVCDLEVNDCGCVLDNVANVESVKRHLCCHLPVRCNAPLPHSDYGYFKENPNDSRILNIYGRGITQVIVVYQSNCINLEGGEYMIPDYAFMAFASGIDYMGSRFVNNISRVEKREKMADYIREKKKVVIYLSPLSLSEFAQLEKFPKIWSLQSEWIKPMRHHS